MDKQQKNLDIKRPAILAGIGLLLMAALAGYANFGVLKNNGSHELAAAAFIIVAILDILVAYFLNKIFSRTNNNISFLAMVTRIVYAFILIAAASVLVFADTEIFNQIWQAGLLLFAFHLFLLAYLVYKARFAPTWLAVLLAVAGIGYAVDGIGTFLVPGYKLEVGSWL